MKQKQKNARNVIRKGGIVCCVPFSVLFLLSSYTTAQTVNDDECIKELALVKDVPYSPELSGDSIYWSLVIRGKNIIPCLISNLTNTTKTNINIPNWGGYYCLGDIAFSILCHIVHDIPIKEIIMEKKDYPSDKDIIYFSFVSYGESNRQFLQKKLLQWYEENENKLIWVVDTTSYRTSIDWYSKSNQNPAHGYYMVSNQPSKD